MRGIDFKGKTSSAEAKLHSSVGGTEAFPGASDVFTGNFSAVVDFLIGVSVETDDVVVSKSTQPKDPSKNSSKEEVLVPARTILILPKPSQWSCTVFLSK